MRCFVPATDDEIYAFIERYGIAALVPYRVDMPVARREDIPDGADDSSWTEMDSPRRAA
ncbi:MAG: hypothetical protein R3F18_08755 [Lysobacterales bacterium]|nr:hypothetical protein [Xanthomonadales bacterium]MCB1612694.1 hypothetical protein [Xanthomonadales bacterium]MCP5477061.1 hypothetical protein [Rhodanobacteraceae bacterium]